MTYKLWGAGLSPFVRKVRVALAEKGQSYEHEPIVPFALPEGYEKKHPLKKIPCFEDGGLVVPDSSAICAYLERKHPEPALYPSDAAEYARAIWYEEFGDAGLLNGTIVPFVERVINKRFMQKEPDEARIQQALGETLPPLLDYLEENLGDQEYLVGGRFTIADVAVGSQFVNMGHGGERVDASRWPKVAAYVDRIHSRPSFKGLIEEERASIPG